MRPYRLLFLVLLIGWTWELGSQQYVRFRPPRLIPADEETILEPGATLRVRCEGRHPVTWNYTSLASDISSRLTIEEETASGNKDYPYVSHLEIRDVTYQDVGYQSCFFIGTQSLEVVQNVSRVYLYVNDPKHLLVKTGFDVVTVTQNQPAVLPCRPTHPSVNVTLFKDGTEITDLAERSMTFEPTEGYIIHSPVLYYHNGQFVCKAERGSVREKQQVFAVFNPATDSVQEPWIDKTDAVMNAVLGNNFTLECRVRYQESVFLSLNWDVPDASTGLKTGRIVQLEQTTDSSGPSVPGGRNSAAMTTRKLLVTNTQVEDEGYYTCHVEDHSGHTNKRREFVTVRDKNKSSVRLTTDTTRFVLQLRDSLKIVVTVDAYPEPEVKWYNPAGGEITELLNTAGLKYDLSVSRDQSILQVFDLGLQDMGAYKITARTPDGNATDSITFNVTVEDIPRVLVKTDRRFFEVGQRHVLVCEVTGYPVPSISWRFKHCPSRDTCDLQFRDIEGLPRLNDEKEANKPAHVYSVNSSLTLTARKSGYYQCYARNRFPSPGQAEVPFWVSDIPRGFGIVKSEESVVEGDNVTLTCGGSNFAFDSPDRFAWYRTHPVTGTLAPVREGDGVRLVRESTEYSHRIQMVMDRVGISQSGLYSCFGSDLQQRQNRTQTRLVVQESGAPYFLPTSNMQQSATLNIEEGKPGELNCTVSGLPVPRISWTKDGAPLRLEDDNRVHLSVDRQRLLISAAISDDAGNYQCRAENRVGAVVGSVDVAVPDQQSHGAAIAISVVMVVLVLLLAACLAWKIKQQKGLQQRLSPKELEDFTKGKMSQFNPALTIDEQAGLLPYDEEWEFPKDRLILGRQIGSGAFGRVLKAEAIGLFSHEQRTVVAVKMPKSGSDPDQIRSLMAELKIMIQLGKHLNVVNLLGAVTKHAVNGEFMVMVEYCRHGNLHQYLQRHKHFYIDQVDPISGEYNPSLGEKEYEAATQGDLASESYYKTPRRHSNASSLSSANYNTDMTTDTVCNSPAATGYEDSQGIPRLNTAGASIRPRRTPLTTRDLLRWSYQVARGMEYLASRRLLHGDLAARNILLAEDNIVKISDFGLSRDIYKTRDYKKKGKGLLPVKWMAIESIQESIFSTQSDVWSFGVVLWELFSLGASPYPGMEYDVNFVRRLRDGYRMEMPKFSPKSVYALMLAAWRELPGERPSFTELSDKLGHLLEDQIVEEYMRLNEPYAAGNEEYFSRRTDYVNQIASPDYQNVTAGREPDQPDPENDHSYINVDPQRQAASYAPTNGKGVGERGGVPAGADGYLLMSPSPETAPGGEQIFSPRPTAVVRPTTRFDFPPAPGHEPTAPSFYNPAYHEASKVLAAGGKVPSTPKMGTRVSRASRSGAAAREPEEDADHYLSPIQHA